jgi:acyl-CoA synthetase (NDP forming)/GNAT superfamily N-acetyltransferase
MSASTAGAVQTAETVRVILADGRIAHIRPLGPDDRDAVLRLHHGLPERDRYFRFFTTSPAGFEPVLDRIVQPDDVHRLTLGGFLGEELVGVAHFEVLADPSEAEVALAVDHRHQARGLGTLLLEHLASAARQRGVRQFVAEVLKENASMIQVFRDAGMPLTMRSEGSTYHVRMNLVEGYPPEVGERERQAGVASLRALLRPRSVAVVGASRRADAIGHAVVANLLAEGFTGSCHPVNPRAETIAGLRVVASARDLPPDVDLAVLCVPAAAVPQVAEECGQRGVRALAVITAGLTGDAELAGGLLAAVRRHGMRLVGPNCLGVINTDPDVRLNATFARGPVPAGRIGVVTQSGGVGIALLEQFAAAGLGISNLVSTGDKYDVSGNDMLLWWLRDDSTDLAVIYVESFGNPRKFATLARALSERKPVLAVRTGRTEAAQRAAASHTAAAATPAVTRDALYGQAGILPVESLTDIVGTAAVLSWQPLPAGNRVMVVGNVGGIGVIAADACATNGLALPDLTDQTRRTLTTLLPSTASLLNPVDTTAGVKDEVFHDAVRAILHDSNVDALVVLAAPTAVANPADGLADVVADSPKPVVVVRVGQDTVVEPLRPADPAGRPVPAFGDPVIAIEALARTVRYAEWRARPKGTVPDLPDIDIQAARALVAEYLDANPDGGWLDQPSVSRLLAHFGVPVITGVVARDADSAVAAFRAEGGPVVVKAIAEGVLHKSRAGGVILGVRDEQGVLAAVSQLRQRFGPSLRGVLVQPMVEPGRELLIGVHNDPTFGPLVAFGLGGVDTDLIGDRAYRLVPLTDRDAVEMLGSLRASPALFGPKAHQQLDTQGIIDLLLRVGRLAEMLPEVAELDLNPVVVTDRYCRVVDARIRVAPTQPVDPYLRRLRT